MDTRPYMQDRAAEEFFSRLAEGMFQSTRCVSCGVLNYPPRVVCPDCLGEEMEWVDLPREGTLLAFTWQEAAIRCRKPEILGLVELEGVGNVLTRIDAPYESLRIGQRVAFDTWTSPDGLVLHQFRPLEEG
ncbi:OB-fold domain-containing protein [Candidatus Solincola tengchongensis]|uniref:Zn-ribbon domain-containing OB-fold protein n=1 Tax=Candidatus Solincola tengchongensis TaxID=2900693 RepID=UPI00257E4458|nr:OB-fold domain-containing protein [Candidatus Solincola tengchongensis]